MNTHARLYRLWTLAAIVAILVAMIPLGAPGQIGSADAAPLKADPGDIVINEIMQNPSAVSDSAGEWLELYNPTASDIDINGWTISDNDTDSHVIANGGPLLVPAEGYLVLGNNTDTASNGGVPVAYSYGGSWFLANGADEVVLTDDASTEIDRVEYDGGPVWPDPNGASMALSDPALDNSVGENWCESTTPFGDGDMGTPGEANDCSVTPPPVEPDVLVINEIMQNPSAVSDGSGEWFELYNPTTGDIDINGWTISDNDSDSHVISNGGPLLVPAGGYLVLGNNTDTASNGGVPVAYSYGGSWYLANGADEVVLTDDASNEIDRVEYDGGPQFPDPNGASMSLTDPSLDNNIGGNWCESTTPFGDGDSGTPGAANICTVEPPTPPVTIQEIQTPTDGTDQSPYVGTEVETQGVVTAFFDDGGDRYFFIQDGTGPWSGLVLFEPNGFLNVGDLVQVTGTVQEYFGLTEIGFGDVSVVSSGNPLPAAETLASGDVSQEMWEAVLVRVEEASVTNPALGFGEWQIDDGSGPLAVDDMGSYAYAPENGDQLAHVQGPLNYSFGAFKVEPRDDSDIAQYLLISQVQGSGASSPEVDRTVVVEGIVVADYQSGDGVIGDLDGFFVQEEDADADSDPMTSEGVFVYDGGSPGVDVTAGDLVQVEGGVSEYYDLTEISAPGGVTLISSDNALPTAASLSLPVTNEDDFEAYEGMRVSFSQDLVISEYYNFDRYGEIVLTSERHLTPTAEFEPGSAQEQQAVQDYLLDSITLDDGRSNQNPDPALHPAGGVFSLDHRFRGGDTIEGLTGVMDYDFGIYRIQPTEGGTYNEVNPRPASPDYVGGNLEVASFNVLNYFTTLDNAGSICGPAGDQECRGADNATELERQRSKILAALQSINADVFGLIEIQNDQDQSVADLVAGLNAAMGAGTYDYIPTGYIGTDAIKQALIYKPATVTPAGPFAILDSSVDSRFIDAKNRPVLAQSFEDNSTGSVFTVAVNHLKSKGSDCDALGDPDTGDGQGNCNLTREAAAEALVDWLATDPTSSGSPYALIVGDLNSYDHEDPIDAIKAGSDDAAYTADDWTDLIYQYLGEDAYSYVFDGQIGYLDHGLANYAALAHVTGTTIWHINADEPDILDYDTSFKQPAQDALYEPNAYRSSDHDPVIVGLDFSSISPEAIVALEDLLNHYADMGDITGNNTTKALLDHLEKAASYLEGGKDAAAQAQLQAFINQVQGKAPKFVTQDAADVLTAVASALLGG